MIQLIFGFVICVFVTASFVDTYPHRYNDYNDVLEEQDENVVQRLMHLLHYGYKYNKENRRNIDNDLENWTGRWMPDRPDDTTPPPKILPKDKRLYEYESITEFPNDIYMGHVSPECDDAKTNLTIDWDHTPAEYTCYGHKITPSMIPPKIYCENIPKTYKAAHKCMNQKIEYDDDIPIYGPHRPLWPVYGEYKFLPKQRWLHNLEHGAIVMLYHPCANPLEVERLKNLVNKCLWRHVITPYSYLNEEHPLALLSWGCRLTMSYVDPTLVNHFIRKKALRAPEWRIAEDGQFEDGLLSQSNIVSDITDSVLCPNI
ncbi:Tumor protein p53-inducible protein 13 [Formica fusca]